MPVSRKEVVADLLPVRRAARLLYHGAVVWAISAAVHAVALAMDGWRWSGAVSFRKPLVFSLSIALLLATVGWVLDRLPDRPRLAGSIAWTFLVASSLEVGLIAVQTWRGRASHFNVAEPGDAAVFAAMGVAVGVMSLCLIGLLVWSAIERPRDPLIRLSVIGGLALVATGLGIGQWIVELGNAHVASHLEVPDTVIAGEAGVAKFPHAVAFHGIQVFIVSAVMLRRGRLPDHTRLRLMRLVFWSFTSVLVCASAQTVAGLAPFDRSVWSVGMALSLGAAGYGLVRIWGGSLGSSDDREVPVALR